MPNVMPKQGADFELPPQGSHIAVCYRVVDLGTQETNFQGKVSHKPKILISWELPEELMQNGRPFTIGKSYTLSSHSKSNLRQDLESWRGKKFEEWEFGEFDIGKLIGVGCMLGVVHNETERGTFSNINALMRLPKGTTAPFATNPMINFSLSDRPFSRPVFETLSDRLRETIMKSPEYKAAIEGRDPRDEPPPATEGDYGGRDLDDEIPF